ncbi:MAG: YceI family protein, partial [candidate division Zixibacteria bacterium]|nr:YceI family protein [candidate division Zixibacteria bacterium]
MRSTIEKFIMLLRSIKEIFLAVFLLGSSVAAETYSLDPTYNGDTVYFNSTARLEFVGGKTENVSGMFTFDPENPEGSIGGVLAVDLRTLKTGIATRDGHMRDNHLHTEKYPFAYFHIDSLVPVISLSVADSIYIAKVMGRFYIHGVYREIEADLTIVRSIANSKGESIKVRAKFAIKLDEFKIPRPRALFLKLAETIEVVAVFRGFSGAPAEQIEL